MSSVFRIFVLLFWIAFGLALILAPWSDYWETNYFIFQYPELGFFLKNAFLRGAVSGLGFMDVLLSLEAFRRRTSSIASRT